MGEVADVKKEDIFKRKASALNPWTDPAFNKIESLGGEPGFKVDDIAERLGLVDEIGKTYSKIGSFFDLEDAPSGYGTKLQFLQTDGGGKLSWAWPYWSKTGSTVYYKSGKVAIGHAAPQEIFHIAAGQETLASRISCKISPWRQWECLDSNYGFAWGIAADDKKFHLHYDTPMGTVSVHGMCFDALNSRVGILDDTPSYPCDIGGNTQVQGTLDVTSHVSIHSNAEVRFYDNGNYVGFEAPALSADQIWVLPTVDASQAGSPLVSNASGTLSWAGDVDLGAGNFVTTGTLGSGRLTVDSGAGQSIIIKGTSTGDANIGWIGFYDSDGTTRRGHIGDGSSTDDDIYIGADTGYLRLLAAGYISLGTHTYFPDDVVMSFGASLDYSIGFAVATDTLQIVDGTTLGSNIRLKLDSSGHFDFISGNITTLGTVDAAVFTTTGYVALRSSAEIRFYDNGNYVGFEAPALGADQIWVLPAADGGAGEVLSTDGAGALSWAAGGGVHAMATHSDDDTYNILTSGSLGAGNATLGTIGCNEITVADGHGINLQEDITFTGAATENIITFPDNLGDALNFKEGANSYLAFVTTTGAELVKINKIFAAPTGSKIGTLLLKSGSIGDTSGAIDFADENLSTSGTLTLDSTATPPGQLLLQANSLGGVSALAYSADNLYIGFDTYWDGSVWKSLDVGSNFDIQKYQDLLKIRYDSGVALGSAPTMNDGIVLTTAGKVGIGVGSVPRAYLTVGSPTAQTSNVAELRDNTSSGYAMSLEQDNVDGWGLIIDTDSVSTGDPALYIKNPTLNLLTVDSDGVITADGCMTDGTCEIMKNENAVSIIDDILKTGSGKKDKYDHERMDMKKIHGKYPFLVHKSRTKEMEDGNEDRYYDKLGAKADLAYVAILQLNEKIISLENEIKELRIGV